MTGSSHHKRECWCGINHDLERRISEARIDYDAAEAHSSESALTAYKLGKLDGLQLAKLIQDENAKDG